VPENKRRVVEFKGLCIARRNRGLGSNFTLRAVLNNHAVERIFPLYSPHILEMEVTERRKVARSKLYYLRRKPLKFSRVGTGGSSSEGAPAAEGVEGEEEEKRGTRRKPTGAEVANAAARKAAQAKSTNWDEE
jgi:large subunit ribosomal protein L19